MPLSKYGTSQPPVGVDVTTLTGWAGPKVASKAMSDAGFSPFAITSQGPSESSTGRKVALWEIYKEVTGQDPDLSVQPTGNCVSAGADDALELLQAIAIKLGMRAKWEPIYNPFMYGTGRVLIGKGKIKGAGMVASWQVQALLKYGTIRLRAGLPKYTRENVDAWGDGRASADGQKFQDFVQEGVKSLLKSAAPLQKRTAQEVMDALIVSKTPLTIASSAGCTMLPDSRGFHRPSGVSHHQQSIWGGENTGPDPFVVIKNQWGDVHGRVTMSDGTPIPPGFRKVRLDDFERYLLRAPGTEVFAYSVYEGFPAVTFDAKGWA